MASLSSKSMRGSYPLTYPLIIQAASKAPKNPLASPEPVGQKGSMSVSPATSSRRDFPFRLIILLACWEAKREVKSNSATSLVPYSNDMAT